MRSVAKSLRSAWRRIRFHAWARRVDLELRRNGGRLVVDAPFGASFDRPPRIKSWPRGTGSGVTRLTVGQDVRLDDVHLELWARGDNVIEIGNGFRALSGVRLMVRGGRLSLGERTLVRDHVVLKAEGYLSVGCDVLISQSATVHCTESVKIGDRCTAAERVTITDSDHAVDGSDQHHMGQPLRVAPVELEPNVLLSAGVVVLRGARLGRNSVVAANSVVASGDYPPSSLISGAPGRVAKSLGDSPDGA